jgi:hypothetical protein
MNADLTEVEDRLLTATRTAPVDIDAALRRIEQRTPGTCRRCGAAKPPRFGVKTLCRRDTRAPRLRSGVPPGPPTGTSIVREP